jgi:hypothetical protein
VSQETEIHVPPLTKSVGFFDRLLQRVERKPAKPGTESKRNAKTTLELHDIQGCRANRTAAIRA